MWVSQRLRFRVIICDIFSRLEDMALDPRAYPGVVAQNRPLGSSASIPSLRSRESEVVPLRMSTPDNGGGNVRVVVRVRGFLPRGILHSFLHVAHQLKGHRNRSRRRMFGRDEPRYPSDEAPHTEHD